MAKLFNLAVVTGKYEKDGKEKNSYTQIGKLIQNDEGKLSIKLDTLPINKDWDGWISVFEPRSEQKKKDDLPF